MLSSACCAKMRTFEFWRLGKSRTGLTSVQSPANKNSQMKSMGSEYHCKPKELISQQRLPLSRMQIKARKKGIGHAGISCSRKLPHRRSQHQTPHRRLLFSPVIQPVT